MSKEKTILGSTNIQKKLEMIVLKILYFMKKTFLFILFTNSYTFMHDVYLLFIKV